MRRQVVVTGLGCVTPIGHNARELESNLYAGRIGVGRLTLFDVDQYPVRIAAEVQNWNLDSPGPDVDRWRNSPRQTAFALGSAFQACQQSNILHSAIDRSRLGVYLGCGEPFDDFQAFTRSICDAAEPSRSAAAETPRPPLRIFDPEREREWESDMPAIHIAEMADARGPVLNCISACVSSTQAIGESVQMIRDDEVDVMLCGGAHSTIHAFGMTGFQRLGALSARNHDPTGAVRPFDADRDGFVIGEGGAVFVVEELEHALRRGAPILGEITGYGSAQDAFRVTDLHPEGRGAATAIRAALKDARLNTDDIDYINAHGTGTIMNDRIETLALKRAFGDDIFRIPVSSTKSMLGHATTACGAIELAVCLMSLTSGVIPPTMNHERPGPDCDLDYVPRFAREVDCRHVMTNNIGFGGQNASLIVSRYDGRAPGRALPSRAA